MLARKAIVAGALLGALQLFAAEKPAAQVRQEMSGESAPAPVRVVEGGSTKATKPGAKVTASGEHRRAQMVSTGDCCCEVAVAVPSKPALGAQQKTER